MKSLQSSCLALLTLALAHAASATTVTEMFVGTIKGAQTIDTDGIFGPVGDDLAGQQVTIKTRYVTALLPRMAKCKINPMTCSYDRTQQSSANAVVITFTVRGKQSIYSSTIYGDVIFNNSKPYQFVPEANVASGQNQGGRGGAVNVSFIAPVIFGKQLSPGNKPVIGVSDLISILKPGDTYASEQLTFVVTKASR